MRQDELDAMEQLAPILGRTPRSIKRFVNLYRLIKAGIEEEDKRASFLANGDFRYVLLLLALDTGMPEVAPTIFNEIRLAAEGNDQTLMALADGRAAPLDIIKQWPNELKPWDVWDALTVKQLANWLEITRRYSFHRE
jgi:hypothetical protein